MEYLVAMDQLIETLYSPTDPETADFVIFQKDQLDIYDHYRFWIRVLQDHMIFIMKRSKIYEQRAREFLDELSRLKTILMTNIPSDFYNFNNEIIDIVEKIHEFKKLILTDLLTQQPQITLPATFISHMLNELEHFRFIVHYVKVNNEFPAINNLNEHELWLQDIVGHLGGIKDNLDPVEKLLRKRLCEKAKIFKALHNKSLEFIGYFKHGVTSGNAMKALDISSIETTILYLNLVREILSLRSDNVVLGIIDRHMLIHMIFEEIYYIKCLSHSQQNYDPLASCQIKPDERSAVAIQDMP